MYLLCICQWLAQQFGAYNTKNVSFFIKTEEIGLLMYEQTGCLFQNKINMDNVESHLENAF